jgi:hypothetical protein
MENFCDTTRLGEEMDLKDYVLVGDIVEVHLTFLNHCYFWPSPSQMFPVDGVDPKRRPYLSVCGVVASYNRTAEDKKIELSPTVFTHVLLPKPIKDENGKGKDKAAPAPASNPPSIMPVAYVVPKTVRWAGERAPKVHVGTYVCCEGFLHMVHRKPSDGMVDHFDAELDKVTFLGRPYTPPTSRKSLPAPPSTPGESYRNPNSYVYWSFSW